MGGCPVPATRETKEETMRRNPLMALLKLVRKGRLTMARRNNEFMKKLSRCGRPQDEETQALLRKGLAAGATTDIILSEMEALEDQVEAAIETPPDNVGAAAFKYVRQFQALTDRLGV